MQQVMTGWIEAADAREVCDQAMAEQMLGLASPQSVEPWSFAAMLRLDTWLEPVNRRLGLGSVRADH
jgi:hypothetical protein